MHNKVILTSTDTTIGFISQSVKALDRAKERQSGKKYITALPDLKSIKKRVPKKYKNLVRRAKKTTFILSKDYSFRVIKNKEHLKLIKKLGWAYTTSANKSGEDFNLAYAKSKADIIIEPLKSSNPSIIYKLGKSKLIKIR